MHLDGVKYTNASKKGMLVTFKVVLITPPLIMTGDNKLDISDGVVVTCVGEDGVRKQDTGGESVHCFQRVGDL